MATCPSIQLSALLFVYVLFVLLLFAILILLNQGRTKGEGLSTTNWFKPAPVIFIAGRHKAALLFWFFGDFRCGALLFMVIYVIYKYKNRYKYLLNVRLAGDHLCGKLLFTWLSLVMSMVVSFCAVFFPTRCLR